MSQAVDDERSVLELVTDQSWKVLDTYRIDAGLIEEHANNERRISQGGYGDRQIYELVQNAADELRDSGGGEIAVVLTGTHLYCANEGHPVTAQGAETILRMSVSRKRGGQIGRFGVGVKSVLSVSDAPQFFSKVDGAEIGFGFDREWSAEQIRAVHPDVAETPVLRMARRIDVDSSKASDPVLRELLSWATTVVRLPLKPRSVERLASDLADFPSEFLLFSPHVGTVTLDNRRGDRSVRRQIFQLVEGDRRVLQEVRSNQEDHTREWRVFTRAHRPTVSALHAAGELHDRPEIDVSWGVPARSAARGAFWAYFPTKFATTLRGILNAPWKTSEDRQAIFDGNAFNDELIHTAASLVVETLPKISTFDDPAVYIDYLPGRGREAPQFADERLTAEIWSQAAVSASLVDMDGTFRKPDEVRLHPEALRDEWLRWWAGYAGRPAGWVHHSVERRERRSRVVLILGRAEQPEASVREWLEALVADATAEASATAIRIIADMVKVNSPLAEDALRSHVVLTESDGFVAPERGKVFRRTTADDLRDEIRYVDEEVVAEFGMTGALDALGIREADAEGRLAAVVDQGFDNYSDDEWAAFWRLSRAAGPDGSVTILRDSRQNLAGLLKVRTVSGKFAALGECLMPGPVVPSDGSRDGEVAVDLSDHEPDREVLRRLGARDRAESNQDPHEQAWFPTYQESAWDSYLGTMDGRAARPRQSTMQLDGAVTPGPLAFLDTLSPAGRASFLENLPPTGLPTTWTIQIGRQHDTQKLIESPLVWMARRHGYLHTSLGLRRLRECVSPDLAGYSNVLPVARLRPGIADALGLPRELAKVQRSFWADAIERAADSEDDSLPGQTYAACLASGSEWPAGASTRCRVGDVWRSDIDDSEIAVTSVRDEYDALVREGLPALLAPDAESAAQMAEIWNMRTPAEVLKQELRFLVASEPVSLLELFPSLVSHRHLVEGWSLVRCSELEEITRTPHGMRTASMARAIDQRSVLVLKPEDDLEALRAVDDLLRLGLGAGGCTRILEARRRLLESARVKAIQSADTEKAKILELVGEERLREGLPQGLEEADRVRRGVSPTGTRLAQLALNTHGQGILRHHARDIAARIEDAPHHFHGGTTSRNFVARLGLSESYAGATVVAPPEMEHVDGPGDFPRLHDYQEQVAAAMVDLLLEPKSGRAMLRLPTGAGKTRVAVEAVVRVVRDRGKLGGPILWIAQSDELCEQAVQSWKFVWAKVGPDERLTVNRFWGSNDVAAVTANTQLVVATDAKLHNRLDRAEYAWLREPSLVIVDEAHRAIAPMYTAVLERLGLTHRMTSRPLVGLTATPFRGLNEIETKRLVERFGARRLDEGLFGGDDPYRALQSIGVLAKVDHRELSGSTLTLSPESLEGVERFGVLPAPVEEALSQDTERNQMLLEEISKLPAYWPVLVFATSVTHAKLLAALLNDDGVRASSIDSYTPMAERRSKIEAYREGTTRVITNYGVLAQGFDAPKTRAVVIARPTYSPNVYQQMIGRGLRGPKNGGEDVCLILDVKDNIANYGKDLAFTGFEHLWRP